MQTIVDEVEYGYDVTSKAIVKDYEIIVDRSEEAYEIVKPYVDAWNLFLIVIFLVQLCLIAIVCDLVGMFKKSKQVDAEH